MSAVKAERYTAYKDSGVEWLGDVPAHWTEVRIKDLAFLERGKFTHRPRNDPQMYDGPHPFIQTGDVARANKYVTTYKQSLSDKGTEVSRKFKSGTLLMAIAANIGDVAIVNFDTYFPDSVVGFTPIKSNTDYLFYLFTATRSELDRVKVTSTQDNLNLERLNSLVKFSPPLSEQNAIAAYLDTKTAQIDRQINLLGQKARQYGKLKQSLINETVTRGLDKSVPMKDSSVEWIGEVPRHWTVTAITNVTDTVSHKNHPNEELLSVYRDYGVIIKSSRDDNNNKAGADLSSYKLVEPGFLVINKMKAWQGSLGVSEFRGIVSPAYITCKTNKRIVDRSYLHHLLRCRNYINEYNRLSFGVRVDQWDMRYDDFKYVPVLLPPMAEQAAIAKYLDEKTAHIDRIVTAINTQIDKLKDLRKALINHVVTGKIKVVSEGMVV